MRKLLVLILGMSILLSCGKKEEKVSDSKPAVEEKVYKIGVTQIVSHPALDSVKEGFKKAFEEAGVKAEFDEKNAEGSIATANIIANQFKTDKKDLVFGIATPSAQALVNTMTDIPIIFSAVTDPVASNVIKPNVTGTSDKLDNVGEQLDILLKLNPNVKKIGVIYNTSEKNSIVQLEDIKRVAKEKGLEIVEQGITGTSELPQALKSVLQRADALYIPTDNTVVSGIKLVVSEAIANKKIVVASDEGSVNGGALYTKGLNYFELGKRAGQMAIDILKNGKKPSDIPFETSKATTITVNETTAKELGIDLSNEIFKGAKIVK